MKSEELGKNISEVEVTHISKDGFWLTLQQKEWFLEFALFPWFRDAPKSAILKVKLLNQNHLYWPDLDLDLAVESIKNPEQFPLVAR